MTMSRNQLKAARMLLGLSQEELAQLSDVGVASLRRFETGHDLGDALLDRLQASVEEAGVVLFAGCRIDGQDVGDGVALRPTESLPTVTRNKVIGVERPNVSPVPRRPGRPLKGKTREHS